MSSQSVDDSAKSGLSVCAGHDDAEVYILVIYTGGTIGMKTRQDGVCVPEKDFFHSFLKRQPYFHDVDYAAAKKHSLERPFLAQFPLEPLYLPMNSTHERKRVAYVIYEYQTLIDSANADYDFYLQLALDIKKYYLKFDGFVVLHGTDTMAYTASALSFMLQNLGKPVIITGSQLPIVETRSDGRDNLLSALLMAAHYPIAEVTVFFDNKLFRGNRTRKVNSDSFDAFDSPNLPPLATVGVNIAVNWDLVMRPAHMKKFNVHTLLSPNVAMLRIFPNITAEVAKAFLQPPIEGIVLQCYGAGNFPESNVELLAVLKNAADRGVIIVNTTQCRRGSVSVTYAGSKALLDIGIVPGYDMTSEAALTKLSFVLTKDAWPLEKKKEFLSTNIAGELTRADIGLRHTSFKLLDTLSKYGNSRSPEDVNQVRELMVPTFLCNAVKSSDLQSVKEIVEAFPGNVLTSDYDGRTCLHLAVREAKLEVIKYLLLNGASVHARDRNDRSPLLEAVYARRDDVVQLLLETGAHLVMHPAKFATELNLAIMCGDLPLVKAFLAAKAKPNVWDYSHRTPLHIAAALGHADIVQLLLAAGADCTITDMNGNTALNDAQRLGHGEVIALLAPADGTGGVDDDKQPTTQPSGAADSAGDDAVPERLSTSSIVDDAANES